MIAGEPDCLERDIDIGCDYLYYMVIISTMKKMVIICLNTATNVLFVTCVNMHEIVTPKLIWSTIDMNILPTIECFESFEEKYARKGLKM